MSKTTLIAASLIVGIFGWLLALPNAPDFDIPYLATRIEVMHGVHLNELLFIVYMLLLSLSGSIWRISAFPNIMHYAALIMSLGVFGIISSVLNMAEIMDLFEALRFFLLALFFIVLVFWIREIGANVILRILLIGATLGAVVNLYYTYKYQTRMFGVLPVLFGQNGPGGAIGICVCLSAWLILLRKNNIDIIVALSNLIVGVYTAILSYSKIGQLITILGLISWVTIIILTNIREARKKIGFTFIYFILVSLFYITQTDVGRQYLESSKLLTSKIIDEKIADPINDDMRIMFYDSVFSIVADNPVIGVSYSGFAKAFTSHSSDTYGKIFDTSLNPHNSFLYYISANGLPAAPVVAMLFLWFIYVLFNSLKYYGIKGVVVWASLVFAYILYGNTLPSLFNTWVLYLPAAIAFSQVNSSHKKEDLILSKEL